MADAETMASCQKATDAPDASCLQDIARLRRFVATGTTQMAEHHREVPLDFYRDQALWSREVAALRTIPVVVATSAMIAETGSFVTKSILSRALLITRDSEGKAHVLANSCRHRGAKVAQGEGKASRHVCAYHAWTYGSDGRLIGMPGREGFAGLDQRSLRLFEYPSEERHGLVFAVLDGQSPCDVDAHLGSMGPELAGWRYGEQRSKGARHIKVEANWKSALEAFSEGYHIPYVHRETLRKTVVGNTGVPRFFGKHFRLLMAMSTLRDAEPNEGPLPSDHREHVITIYWVYPNLIIANDVGGTQYINILPGSHVGEFELDYTYITFLPDGLPEEASRLEYIANKMWKLLENEDGRMLTLVREATAGSPVKSLYLGRNEPCVQHVYDTVNELVGMQ